MKIFIEISELEYRVVYSVEEVKEGDLVNDIYLVTYVLGNEAVAILENRV